MAIDAIVEAKRRELAGRRAARPLEHITAGLEPTTRDFYGALSGPAPAFILEIKPRSPSLGELRKESDLAPAVLAYAKHASVVSVLADAPFFGGSLELLQRVRAQVPQPVLCKDFILDPYQVFDARHHDADAVLLMLSVLDDDTFRRCADVAAQLSMGVLTEVHTEAELARAAALGARVIGINNRDLRTLAVSLDVTGALARRAPRGAILIAESGIRSHEDVERLRSLVDGFLVGTAIMQAPDPDRATRALVYGRTKICGLTRMKDATATADAGATHGGLVFAAESRRRVTPAQANELAASAELDWVGVFVNEAVSIVAERARTIGLAAVQLHGEEDAGYVAALRAELPASCSIWKAMRVRDRIPDWNATGADLVLLDSFAADRRGGTGQRFDWSLLQGAEPTDRYALSGGLSPDNVGQASAFGLALLDASSGVEVAPGVKDARLLEAFFSARRGRRRGDRA